MEEEQLVLVDGDDREVGSAGKLECHEGAGRLHRAFTAMVFDRNARLLLARRAPRKMLWPGFWDATFASHPRAREEYAAAAERRMPEELGASCAMSYSLKFEYHVRYGDAGSENEVCALLLGTLDGAASPRKGEIDAVRWIGAGELVDSVEAGGTSYCPWMLAALCCLSRSGRGAAGGLAGSLGAWFDGRAERVFARAADESMAGGTWRQIS